jgi:hypothetical protein
MEKSIPEKTSTQQTLEDIQPRTQNPSNYHKILEQVGSWEYHLIFLPSHTNSLVWSLSFVKEVTFFLRIFLDHGYCFLPLHSAIV